MSLHVDKWASLQSQGALFTFFDGRSCGAVLERIISTGRSVRGKHTTLGYSALHALVDIRTLNQEVQLERPLKRSRVGTYEAHGDVQRAIWDLERAKRLLSLSQTLLTMRCQEPRLTIVCRDWLVARLIF